MSPALRNPSPRATSTAISAGESLRPSGNSVAGSGAVGGAACGTPRGCAGTARGGDALGEGAAGSAAGAAPAWSAFVISLGVEVCRVDKPLVAVLADGS